LDGHLNEIRNVVKRVTVKGQKRNSSGIDSLFYGRTNATHTAKDMLDELKEMVANGVTTTEVILSRKNNRKLDH
jgi:hypothetical protein